ncbi:MAG: hypothetical protein U0835_23965 [Isosphaeraceae bacterium]
MRHLRAAGRLVAVLAVLATASARADDPPVSDLALSDLAPYRAALDGKPEGPATPATFRQLWDQPERFQGKRVVIRARLDRRFRQGAVGTFPPLVEAWATSTAGDPFCLVYPASEKPEDSRVSLGSTVTFEGVFLRLLKYQGGDAPRLAPLIVGSRSPSVISGDLPARPMSEGTGGFSRLDWSLGVGAAVLVVLFLARQYVNRPVSRSGLESATGRPPDFVDPP